MKKISHFVAGAIALSFTATLIGTPVTFASDSPLIDLQQYLLGEITLTNIADYDLDGDGVLTGIDLTLMRYQTLNADDTQDDNTPDSDIPDSDNPDGDTTGEDIGDTQDDNTPDDNPDDNPDDDDDNPDNDNPDSNIPDGNTPPDGSNRPDGDDRPDGGNRPGGDTADDDNPDDNNPNIDNPDDDTDDADADNIIYVSTVDELYAAVENAAAGDIICVAAGTYTLTSELASSSNGSPDAPIILRAADSENMPVFCGTSYGQQSVLHISGEYWTVENITISTGEKAVIFDHADYSVLSGCDIGYTGSEAVAIRDGSSYCTVQNCTIHDTGLVSPGYGEGVYIGTSSTSSSSGYNYYCDYNLVDGCTFYNVTAEHVDVKEYTTGTEIAHCLFYGDGMSGENCAGSFVDIAGRDCYVHDNTGYRDGNVKIVAAFEMHDEVSGWATNARFENNTLYMDQPYGAEVTSRRMYIVDAWDLSFSVSNNYVDYGEGLKLITVDDWWDCYNSEYVTFT